MDYIEFSTLRTLLNHRKEGLKEITIKAIAKNLLRAVKMLHSQKICHRDIWPKNIHCSKDGT